MSNLLPPRSERHVRIEYRARFLLAASLVFLACAGLGLLALVPAEIAVASLPMPAATSTPQTTGDPAADRAALMQAQGLLRVLGPLATAPSLDPIAEALSLRGSGITISSISYALTNRSLVIQGSATTPEVLNAFRDALRADPRFGSVSVPVGALIGNQNSFTISMVVQS